MLNQFLVAGNETTTKLIASAVRLLLERPERDAAAARRARRSIPGFVEEALRLEPPVQGLYRTAVEDTEVGGRADHGRRAPDAGLRRRQP